MRRYWQAAKLTLAVVGPIASNGGGIKVRRFSGNKLRPSRPLLVAIAALVVALGITDCGGQTKTITVAPKSTPTAMPTQGDTATVEQKFGVCIAEAGYMGSGIQPDCDPTTLSASPYVPADVSCVYKTGNEYTCQATAPDRDASIAAKINGTYDVTYDGSSLAWQQTGS